MATVDKAPYKLVIKLDSARPDALGQALGQIRDIAADYDSTGKGDASITIESYKESPLTAICEAFEEWLYQHAIGLGCEMKISRPGIRPEMLAVLRARHKTPMDDNGWEQEDVPERGPIIIAPPLQLSAPSIQIVDLPDWVEAEVVEDDGAVSSDVPPVGMR